MMNNYIIFILLLTIKTNCLFASPQIIDKVVALVGKSIILKSDVDKILQIVKYNAQEINQPLPNNKILQRQVLDQLIIDNIILQTTNINNTIINDDEMHKVISNIAVQQNKNIDQLQKHLIYHGLDYDIYFKQIYKDLLISKIQDKNIRRRIIILPLEVESLIKQININNKNNIQLNIDHVIIALPEEPSVEQINQAITLANFIVDKNHKGFDFNQLLIIYSNKFPSLKRGLIGWFKLSELPILFSSYMKNISKGHIIGPIHSDSGLHIIKINDILNKKQPMLATELRIYHILLSASIIKTEQQIIQKLQDTAQKIRNGDFSFKNAAEQISEDLNSSSKGGDLGWVSIDKLEPSLKKIILKLKQDEISNPIRSSYGWHLIKFTNKRQVDYSDFLLKEEAYNLIFKRKFIEESYFWIREQKEKFYLKILDNNDF